MKKLSSLALLAAAGMAASASGTVLYSAGFEQPDYSAGNLNAQGANSWQTIFGASNGATGSTVGFNVVNNASNARTGSQYVEINTSQFPNDGATSAYKYGIALPGTFGLTSQDIANRSVHISCGLWMSTQVNANKNSYQLMSVYAGTVNLLNFGLFNSGSTNQLSRCYLGAPANNTGAFVITNGTTTAGTGTNNWLNHWWLFDIVLDYQAGHISAHVKDALNDIDIGTLLEVNAAYNMSLSSSNIFTDADFQVLRFGHAGASNSGGGVNRFDDYQIELNDKVPAPSSVALLGLGGMLAGRRRRR